MRFNKFGKQLDADKFFAAWGKCRCLIGGWNPIGGDSWKLNLYFHQFGNCVGRNKRACHKLDLNRIFSRWFKIGSGGGRKP